jgi:cyclase
MTRGIVLGTLVTVGMLTAAVAGQGQRAPLPELQQVKDNLYFIGASSPGGPFTGGNTGVFITEGGVVVVDTKNPGYGADILARIRAVTPKPVTTIINTHTHGDHTGSNEGFPATVDIVAHENTKTNMAKMKEFAGAKAAFLPKRTFKDKMTIGSGKDRIDLYYFGVGHTDGDTWVVYPALRVMQTGDMFPWKGAPYLDRASGASGVEFPKTLARTIAGVKDVDIILPGHSPLMKWADLQEYQQYNADLVAQLQAAKKAGKTAEAATAGLTLSKYAGYSDMFLKGAVDVIYAELGK